MNMKDVAIIGVGLHPWGKFPDKPWTAMAKDAIDEAMKDAGVQWKDIGFMVSGSQLWGGRKGIYSGTYIEEVMGNRGVPVGNGNNAGATGGTRSSGGAGAGTGNRFFRRTGESDSSGWALRVRVACETHRLTTTQIRWCCSFHRENNREDRSRARLECSSR